MGSKAANFDNFFPWILGEQYTPDMILLLLQTILIWTTHCRTQFVICLRNHMLNFVIWWDLDLDFLFENISMCLKAVSFDGPKDFYLIPRFSRETVKDTSMSLISVSFVRSLKVETGVMGGKMRWINGRVGSPRLNCLIMITFDIIVWIDCLYFILYEGGRGWGGGVKMMVFF